MWKIPMHRNCWKILGLHKLHVADDLSLSVKNAMAKSSTMKFALLVKW
jgi:hypothetical protein